MKVWFGDRITLKVLAGSRTTYYKQAFLRYIEAIVFMKKLHKINEEDEVFIISKFYWMHHGKSV